MTKLTLANMSENRILIADDDSSVTLALRLLLEHYSEKSISASEPNQILEIVKTEKISLILLDLNFSSGQNSGHEGLDVLKKLRFAHADIPVLVLTSHSDLEIAVECMRIGAKDFILKPWDNSKLITRIKELLISSVSTPLNTKARHELIGKSSSISEIKIMIPRVTQSAVSILISGENGTGKRHLAHHISENYISNPSEMRVIDFKKSIVTEQLEQLVSAKDITCIILNRIDLISSEHLNLIRHLCASFPQIKFISTTISKSKIQNIGKELLAKLCLIELDLTPLRSRREDIEEISNHFIKRLSDLYERSASRLSPKAITKLKHHLWPNNLSELKHTLERAIILSKDAVIQDSLIQLNSGTLFQKSEKSSSLNLAILEKEAILEALSTSTGNVTKAAGILGITRTALYRRMEKYDI